MIRPRHLSLPRRGAGTYGTAPTRSSDRACLACPDQSFMNLTNHAQSACFNATVCMPGSAQSSALTPTTDRTCAGCADGKYQNATGALACKAWSDCAPGFYVADNGTASEDRQCAECEPETFQTLSNQLECASASKCEPGMSGRVCVCMCECGGREVSCRTPALCAPSSW